MVSIRSRRARAITPRTRDTTFNAVVEMLNNPKGKQAKKSASKAKQARRVPTPSPPGESGDEQLKDICPPSTKRRKELIDVKQCKYTVVCVTTFNDKKFNQDLGNFRLDEFKVHEYDAKAIKAVQQHAGKARLGYELESALAVVSAPRLKQLTKTINDPSDWESLEGLITDYMGDGFKQLRVDYTVAYSKAPRRVASREMENYDDEDDDQDGLAGKRARGNVYPFSAELANADHDGQA